MLVDFIVLCLQYDTSNFGDPPIMDRFAMFCKQVYNTGNDVQW